MKSINPATGEVLNTFTPYTISKCKDLINNSNETFKIWKKTSFAQRAQVLKKLEKALTDNKEKLANLMQSEMGKTFSEGISEVEKCAWVCSYYAENAEEFLSPEKVDSGFTESFVSFEPMGPILAVMPWNFPLWQVFRFAAPAIMAGNVCVLKHASNVCGCSLAIENLFDEIAAPKGLFTSLLIPSNDVENIIANPHIMAVTLTGSTQAGKEVASLAGRCLKKTVLELGGSDPYLILEDADLDYAAKTCSTIRLLNAGQSCISAKRFIVVESVKEEFEKLLVKHMSEHKEIAPMAREDLRDELSMQVDRSVEYGAKVLLGGKMQKSMGAYYPITVLSEVRENMPAYDEELFGPVGVIIPVKDEAMAIKVANDSEFGLGAAIFSKNVVRAREIAKNDIQAGACFINDFVKSDPRLPFGGIKNSGYGRELSHFGIKEFVNIKTICIK